jgi:hypothetical protein
MFSVRQSPQQKNFHTFIYEGSTHAHQHKHTHMHEYDTRIYTYSETTTD